MDAEKRLSPFSTGSQYSDWQERNCEKCWKMNRQFEPGAVRVRFNCPIDKALGEAYWDDGSVSREIAQRMGFDPKANAYTWDCPELEKNKPPRKAPPIETTPLFKRDLRA